MTQTGNLDPDTGWDIISLLSKINARHTTVVMATHATEIVDGFPKRVLEISAGKVIRDEQLGAYAT